MAPDRAKAKKRGGNKSMTEIEYREQFSDQLRKWLKKRNTTGYELAEATGIKNSNVYFYLGGGGIPRAPHMAKIFTFLNITPVEFWGLE